MVVALVGLGSFFLGTLTGVFIYSHLFEHFKKDIYAKAQKQFSADAVRAKMVEQKIIDTRRKLREQWGDDLSKAHQEVADEEILKILEGPR